MLSLTFIQTLLVIAAVLAPGWAAPTSFQKSNGLKAQQFNAHFATLTLYETCQGEYSL
jgi:hypothetical protein